MSDNDRDRYERVDQAIFEVLIGEFPDASINDQTFAASAIRARLVADDLVLPVDVSRRVERGDVYQSGSLLPLQARRIVWETPWQPVLADWERELLEGKPSDGR